MQELESLISFAPEPGDCYEDFCWSPQHLEWALLALERPREAALVASAFAGSAILNHEAANGPPDHLVYTDIRINDATRVRAMSVELAGLPVDAMAATRAMVERMHPDAELPDDYFAYLHRYASMLIAFYSEAAHVGQAIVAWWD